MKIKYLSISLVLILCFVCLSSCSASSASTSSTNTSSADTSSANENDLPKWSEELEYQIKLAYHKLSYKDDTNFDIARVSMDYHGSYGEYEAVLFTGAGGAMSRHIEVGGHTFKFNTTNVILLYKDGTFTEFQDVFQEGKLTQEDADRLYDVYERIKYERIKALNMPVE